MFWYIIMRVRDGISLSCLLSAAIAGLSFIFCSLVLWPREFYIYELFLLLPLGLFNSLLELTTRTFLTCELSFKSSAHLPVISLKSHTLWIELSLSFCCIFLLRDTLAMGSQPTPLMLFKFTSHCGSGSLVHIHPLSCSATTGSPGKPYHQLSVVHSQCFSTLCSARYKEHVLPVMTTWSFELCDAEDQESWPCLVDAAFPMV